MMMIPSTSTRTSLALFLCVTTIVIQLCDSFLTISHHHYPIRSDNVLFVSSKLYSEQTKKNNKKKKKGGGGGGGGPNSNKRRDTRRRQPPQQPHDDDNKLSSSSSSSSSIQSQQPRPILTLYEEHRNDFVNEQRLSESFVCEHFENCPGCVTTTNVGQVDMIRSAARFFSSTAIRKNRIDVQRSGEDAVTEAEDDGFYNVVIPSDITKWRTQAKLVVKNRSSSWAKDGCLFGLYQRGSHQVLDIPNCQVHHPNINRAVQVLEKATARAGTPAYSTESRDGNGLRYVQLQVERTTGKICLTLVFGVDDLKMTQPSLSRLTKELTKQDPELWHSMWCHCNDRYVS